MGRRSREVGEVHGILLVDKPVGPTSHDLVEWVRRGLRIRRVGHCGTLDPAASGLLVIAVGVATRVVPLLTDADKRYRASILLGVRTDAGDLEGAVIERVAVDPSILARAPAAAEGLVGEHMLAPPVYSAIKVDGERAYDRARRGEDFELAARPMNVTAVDDVRVSEGPRGPVVDASLTVSKGTYIRTLAEVVGDRLGVPACLAGLRRLASGSLEVDDPRALHPEAAPRPDDPDGPSRRWTLTIDGDVGERLRAAVIPIDEATSLPTWTVSLDDEALRRLEQGQAPPCAAFADGAGLCAFVAGLAAGSPIVVVARDAERRLRRWILTDLVDDYGPRLRPQRVLSLPGPAPTPTDNSSPSA
ncbi:MAG: tRNA pseudouridine(55) synthase TruB [Nannocystaceae bacterium]